MFSGMKQAARQGNALCVHEKIHVPAHTACLARARDRTCILTQSNAKARTADVVSSLLSLAPKTATLLKIDPQGEGQDCGGAG